MEQSNETIHMQARSSPQVLSVSNDARDVHSQSELVRKTLNVPYQQEGAADSSPSAVGYQRVKEVGGEISEMLMKRVKSLSDLAVYLYENPRSRQDR